jgi:hypothetical protein
MTKKLKIQFDPTFFETFDGSEEELKEIMLEITNMLENMDPEELKAQSQPVDWDNMDPNEAEILKQALENPKRYLH